MKPQRFAVAPSRNAFPSTLVRELAGEKYFNHRLSSRYFTGDKTTPSRMCLFDPHCRAFNSNSSVVLAGLGKKSAAEEDRSQQNMYGIIPAPKHQEVIDNMP
jgi:hypothetical protein